MTLRIHHLTPAEPLFLTKARHAWEAASDHPDAAAVERMLNNMAECYRQLMADAADCADDVRECIAGKSGCMAVFEDAVGDLKLRAWAWDDDRAARERGNQLDSSRAWAPAALGRG